MGFFFSSVEGKVFFSENYIMKKKIEKGERVQMLLSPQSFGQ